MIKILSKYAIITLILLGYFGLPINAQSKWYKYPGNPVFQGGKSGGWDQHLWNFDIIEENGHYKMWYTAWPQPGNIAGIGYATSIDGIYWKKFENNPLTFQCENEPWESSYYGFSIIKQDSLYYMWYSAVPKNDPNGASIGLAWSKDGILWTKHPDPVFTTEKINNWYPSGLIVPSVIFNGQEYQMWYNGYDENFPFFVQVGYATSKDGIQWKKHSDNPVLKPGIPGSWDDNHVFTKCVLYSGSMYKMWYTGWDYTQWQIGYATSDDGIHWIKSSDNPILETGDLGTWDAYHIYWPEVLKSDSVYNMWYMAPNFSPNNSTNPYGFATTSVKKALEWDTSLTHQPQRIFTVSVFNKEEHIKVDSLIRILPELSGIDLIDAYNKLALAYSLNNEELSFKYAEKALALSEKEQYPEGKAIAYYSTGNCLYVMDKYSEALINQLKAIWIFDSLGMRHEQANLLAQIASIHTFTGTHDLAVKYHLKELAIFEHLGDTASVYHSLEYLGKAYMDAGDTIKAINTFKKSLQIAISSDNKLEQGFSYELLGLAFRAPNTDSSLYYSDKATEIWEAFNTGFLGQHYLKKAETYVALGSEFTDKAEEYFLKSYYKHRNSLERIRIYFGLASIYLNAKKYNKSKEYLDMSLDMCRIYLKRHRQQMYITRDKKLQSEIALRTNLQNIYWLYYRFDTATHNETAAFRNYIRATQWEDSIYNEQSKQQTAMLQGEYETETAQTKIIMLEKENEVKNLTITQSRVYLVVMSGFILIIMVLAWLFIRQNKIKAEHQTILLEQKLLRLQMNPHFIFNALSNILNFIHRKDTVNAANYLTSFSRLLRSTLESSREDYILIEEEIESLKNYLELQLLRYEGRFEYLFEVDENLDIENAIIPPMLVQPFIENAIEHGIRHATSKGKIIVGFRLVENKVICEVEDNGVGREKAWEAEYQKRKTHKSLATEIIQDRIQSLNKKLKQKIKLSIIDLKTENSVPTGTKVVLDIPYLID